MCTCPYSNQNMCYICPCGQTTSAFCCGSGGNGYFVVEY
jgi:hypothetical protein